MPAYYHLTRRRALQLGGAALGAILGWRIVPSGAGSAAAAPLARVQEESGGEDVIFGLRPADAREVLLMATKADSLPADYAPRDLVSAVAAGLPANGQQLVRALIVADTRALVRAAAAEGLSVWINSGYRSYVYQQALFAAQAARRGGDEEAANRYSARPGQSQHQLGTTIDFNNNFRAFGGSPEGQWLWEHAHLFGFVFPYTPDGQERTGYVSEPWHVRWLGRELADWMHALGYQTSAERAADDLVAAVRAAAGLG